MHVALVFLLLLMEESKMWVTLPKLWLLGLLQVRPRALGPGWGPLSYMSQILPLAHFSVHSHDGLPLGCHH